MIPNIPRAFIVIPTKARTKSEWEDDHFSAVAKLEEIVGAKIAIAYSNIDKDVMKQCDIVYFAEGWKNDPIAVDANKFCHELSKTQTLRIIEEV